jgi:hypothetical protein
MPLTSCLSEGDGARLRQSKDLWRLTMMEQETDVNSRYAAAVFDEYQALADSDAAERRGDAKGMTEALTRMLAAQAVRREAFGDRGIAA